MTHAFGAALREVLETRLARFERVPAEAGTLVRAAVAVAVVESGGRAAFVLTRRAAKLRSHASQWALPGGRLDAGETAVDAALREMREEVGLRVAERDVLGLLDDYPTRSGYLITPVVCWSADGASIRANPAEVASVHLIELAQVAREDAVRFVAIPQSPRPVVQVRIEGDWLHAPSAAVVYQFREVLAGRDTRVAHLEQPVFAWR